MSKNCGSCGTPMSKNTRGEIDCPKCYSENFFGFPVSQKTSNILHIKKEERGLTETSIFGEEQGTDVILESGV